MIYFDTGRINVTFFARAMKMLSIETASFKSQKNFITVTSHARILFPLSALSFAHRISHRRLSTTTSAIFCQFRHDAIRCH